MENLTSILSTIKSLIAEDEFDSSNYNVNQTTPRLFRSYPEIDSWRRTDQSLATCAPLPHQVSGQPQLQEAGKAISISKRKNIVDDSILPVGGNCVIGDNNQINY